MAGLRFKLLVLLAACTLWLPAEAQLHRGARTLVRGGQFEKPDSLQRQRDSLRVAEIARQIDSMARADYAADSAAVASLRTDDLHRLDSLAEARFAAARQGIDTTTRRPAPRKRWFMSDSMSLSKVCWLSTVLPGYGQVYNKQYWKLPILYGTVGAGLTLFFHENNTYKPLKRQYNALLENGTARTEELDDVQSRMIRSNTRRQIYLGLTVASYLYFLGDAAVNYRYDASPVKKATTLATIFPGAGQVYNKSYWKLPFVVGGLATTIYTIDWNNRGYKRFKKAYSDRGAYDKALEEHQKDPEHHPDPPVAKGEFGTKYSAEFLKNLKDNYRRNRDLCIIITAGLYVLQIIDAHVDAHLKSYDISDDLSVEFTPAVNYVYSPTVGGHRPTFGFNFNLNF